MKGKNQNCLYLSKIIWSSSKERYFWMGIVCIVSLLPKFVSVYGLKIVLDLISVNSQIYNILLNVLFFVALETIYCIIVGIYNKYVIPRSDIKIRKYLNDKIFKKLSSIDIQCYDDKDFYDIYTLGAKDADKTVIEYFTHLQILISSVLSLIFIIALIATIDIFVLLVPIAAIICSLLFNICIGKLTYKYSNEKNMKERYVDYIKRIFYTPAYAKEMIVLPIRELIFKEFNQTNKEIEKINKKYSSKICVLDILSNTIFSLFGFGLVLAVISWRILKMQNGVGDFVALANASLMIINSFLYIANEISEFSKYKLFAGNIINLLNYQNIVKSPAYQLTPQKTEQCIEFKNVSFAYPFNPDKTVINDISFKIEKNQKIAIVGFNGSGKTTLIKLLLRLYDVSDGEILVEGINVKMIQLTKLRNKFNILFQDFQQFPLTIEETILMKESDSEDDARLVWSSLEKVGLKQKIEKLPNGIKTKISNEFDENGVSFSGGEIQKLMLARIFAQKQDILILDEPSSALDALSENYIFDEIMKRSQDKTIIFITHRLSAAKNADKILLLRDGRIIQEGKHHDLMAVDGEYKTMYEMQAKKYELDSEEKY